MRHFQQIASGVDVLPLVVELYRQPELWNQHQARTVGEGPFRGTDDIWVRFRPWTELVERESFLEPFTPIFYPAWTALPHLRPLVFGLMNRLEAVQLGAVFITRVPAGGQVALHDDDNGCWHAKFFGTKAYLPLESNPQCYSTCGDEKVVMQVGEAWLFNNLVPHSTVNEGETDRMTLIVCMRCE